MNDFLLSPEDLIRITGATRYTKQRRWFREEFGIEAVCNARGEVIMPRAAFDALVLRKWGMARGIEPAREVQLCYD
jgi:hypothetical protein